MRKILYRKNGWLIILILFSLISLFGEVINDRFQMVDFEVYYRTAERMVHHQDIYRIQSDGHFVFKYAPSSAIFFIPFLLFGFGMSKYIFWLAITVALAWGLSTLAFFILKNKDSISNKSINFALFFSILAVVPHIHLEWHLGQVNIILMVLYIGVLKYLLEDNDIGVGILLGISIFIKPFGLIFLPYLIVKKKLRATMYFVLASVVIGVLPILFYPSWGELMGLYGAWISELQIELASKQNLLKDANHTLFSVVARYSPVQFLLVDKTAEKIYQFILLGFLGIGFLKYIRWGKSLTLPIIGESVILISWIPLLAFTSQNAFIFTLPLIVYLIFNFPQMEKWMKVLIVMGSFCIGINMHDVVGGDVHVYLKNISIYTFGSIMLLTVAFLFRKKSMVENEFS